MHHKLLDKATAKLSEINNLKKKTAKVGIDRKEIIHTYWCHGIVGKTGPTYAGLQET